MNNVDLICFEKGQNPAGLSRAVFVFLAVFAAVLAIALFTQGCGKSKESRDVLWARRASLLTELDALNKERDSELQKAQSTYESERGRITADLSRLEELKITKEDIDRKIRQAAQFQTDLNEHREWLHDAGTGQSFRVSWTENGISEKHETLPHAVEAVQVKYPGAISKRISDNEHEMYMPALCAACKGNGTITCSQCQGKGWRNVTNLVTCGRCNGRGKVYEGRIFGWRPCYTCNRTGKVEKAEKKICSPCGGQGKVKCPACVRVPRSPVLIARIEKIQQQTKPLPSPPPELGMEWPKGNRGLRIEEVEAKIDDLQMRTNAMTKNALDLDAKIHASSETLKDAEQKLASLDSKCTGQVRQINAKWDNDTRVKDLQWKIDIITAKLMKKE